MENSTKTSPANGITVIAGVTLNGQPLGFAEARGVNAWDDEQEFCFVCGRCTDHIGEHDDLVELGLARYGDGYTVLALGSREEIAAWHRVRSLLIWAFGYGWLMGPEW